MNQIENIMALADDHADWREAKGQDHIASKQSRQALRAAIEQALTPGEPVAQLGDGVLWCDTCRSVQETTHHTNPNDRDVWCKGEAKWLQGPFYTTPLAPQPQPKQEPQLTLETAPPGTKAPSFGGGAWMKTERGWQWNGGTRSPGSTFPRPGGDWDGRLIAPQQQPEKRPQNCGTGFCSCIECPYPDHFPEAGKMIEPFGYFRSTLGGWEDCAETDDGARPLYEAPQPDHFADAGKPMEREWVDLPPEEIKALANLPGAGRERTAIEMAYAVQAKLRERNGWQA